MPNRLARETSPYLLQHAENPVDWYPWGPEALARARAEDKPILLSIGYAACHWCHVMARESFEDAETAQVMNALFVNVKVDREERPDLDGIYMQAVQAMTGQGGWPMTMFLTPSGEPFYGGTYFPPEDRHGMPSFRRILRSIADAWRTKRDDIARTAASVKEIYAETAAVTRTEASVSADTLDEAYRDIAARFEPSFGGFGGAPKFPHTMTLDFLLRRWARTGEKHALHMVRHSFLKMAQGGMYDQVGGGFHRYAVDARWLVPHFEKMLYDNALLARLGVHLWQATGDDAIRHTTEETLRWAMREMTDASGGWYSSLDADSEHEEGKFYVWSLAELQALLGDDASAVIAHYGATAGGNFEGHNILHVASDAPLSADLADALTRAKRILYDVRATRVWPGRDEKILASWNGLMLRAMAEGARVFDDTAMRDAALANGEFLARHMVRDGRVFRTHTRGESRIAGFLEDHAAIALGFVALYQLTFDRRWLDRTRELAASCMTYFRDDATRTFYDTASDHEALVTRPRDIMDNATPAGTSLAVELLLTLTEYTDDSTMRQHASEVLDTMREPMTRYATMFGHLLGAADMAVHGAIEIAISGHPHDAAFLEFTRTVAQFYLPSLVMAGGAFKAGDDLALLRDRAPTHGKPTAYVCRGYVCTNPATDAKMLSSQLFDATKLYQIRHGDSAAPGSS